MTNKFSKFINLQVKYLTSLLILLALSIGNVWATDPDVTAEFANTTKSNYFKDYAIDASNTVTLATSASSISSGNGGYYFDLSSNSSAFGTNYLSVKVTGDDYTIASVQILATGSGNSKAITAPVVGWENGWDGSSTSADKGLTLSYTSASTNGSKYSTAEWREADVSSWGVKEIRIYKKLQSVTVTDYTLPTDAQTLRIWGIKVWLQSATPSCSTTITTQPEGKTIAVGEANPTLSIAADNVSSYAWKESSDGTSYDGSDELGTSSTYTPNVNGEAQTKHYYCEVTSSCDGTTVVKSDIVQVKVVGAISYYTVTLVPAGGTIVDATGWTAEGDNYTKTVAEGTELALPTFTKANRTFKTWRKSGPADVTSPITVTADVTLTAVWTATVEQVLYSWEGGSPATEVGGTAVTKAQDGSDAETSDINVDAIGTNATYKAIKVQGKISSNAWSGNYIQITTDEAVKTGDKVKITACTTKGDTSKKGSAQIRVGTSATGTQIVSDGGTYNDIAVASDVPVPNTKTFTITATEINTNLLSMTRQSTNTNCWVTKLQIVRETQVEEGDLLTVTFNSNGGSSIDPVLVASGQAVAKPADPTKAHNRFNEWQLSGSAYNFTTPVTSNITLDADWTQLYTISFAAGDGSGDAPAAVPDKAQGETFEVPANTFTAPDASHEFDKWNDGTNNYAPGDTYTVGTANVLLTAQWKALVAKYTVIFKDGETTLDTKLVDVGSNPSDAGIDKTKALFTFAAWQKDAADIALDDASWTSVAANAEITLTARWTKAYASNADFEAYIIANKSEKDDADKAEAYVKSLNYALSTKTGTTFDANDETNNGAYAGLKIKNAGTVLSWNVVAGKVVELKAGVMVANGSLAINGGEGTTIDGGTTGTGDNFKIHYFYSATEALYEFTTSNGSAEVIKAITMRDPYTVSFEAHGDADPSALPGQPSVTLPNATNGTASLLGWFTEETGGTKIGDAGDTYIPTDNITLHAQWESVSTDARLASITFSSAAGTLEPAFNPEVVNYTYTMPYPTAEVPTITGATKANDKAQAPVIDAQAAAWGETAQVHGVAESGDTKNYFITMKLAPKDGVSIIKVTAVGGAKGEVTGLYAGDGDVSLSSNNKMDNGKYIGFTLDGTTLQAGDRVNVHTTEAGNTAGSHIIFYDNMTDKTELYDTEEIGGTGDNIFTINAAMVGATTAYVYRSNADDTHKWNGKVDFIEVTRAMNPVLTAITFDGVDAEPGVGNTFSALLPNGTNLASMTVVPTIVKNGEGGSAAPTAAWAWGDNTFRVTDKDGDYTDYTITLTEAASPSAAPVITTQPADGNYYEGATIAALEVVATGSGELSYQWYLGVDAIDGATAATYTPTVSAIGSYVYHCVVTNTEAGHPATSLASANATVTIADDPAAIKLLDGEGNINTTDFVTAVSAGTVNFGDEDHNCATFGSSTTSGIVGATGANKFIIYDAKTTQTKIKFVLYNTNSSSQQLVLQKLVEGGTATEDVVIDVPSKERFETDYYVFNNAANHTMYVSVKNTNIKVLQVKVIDDGTALKQAGEVGYSLNLNLGRPFLASGSESTFEGLTTNPGSNYKVLNSTELQTANNISFTVASPITMTLVSTGAKYQVSTNSAGEGDEYVAGTNEHSLTAGTWYIHSSTGSNMKFTSISFSAPKCAEPAFNSLANSDVCEGDPYVALNGTATVADAGVPTYQWYKEDNTPIDGATSANYLPTEDGKYYVIAINHLEGFSDNEKKSDLVTVVTVAGTVINVAPANVRKDAGEPATLTVDASGKNLHYAWKESDTYDGTYTDVEGATDAASLNVTVPTGVKYYKVVVSSACGDPVETIAKVEEWVELSQVDVTATTEWDWVNAGENNKLSAGKNVEILMANIRENDVIPTNDATFNSQALLFYGENVRNVESGRAYASVGHISFNTTVPGAVFVEFSDNGSNNRRLSINGKLSEPSASKTDVKTFMATVPAGEVVLMGVKEDGTGENQYIRISKITFVKMDYTREVNSGRYGTICLPNGGKMYGGALYEVAYKDETKIYFDEILNGEMVAGRPYIFLPNAGIDLIAVAYTDEANAEADSYHGLIGFIGASPAEELQVPDGGGNYILQNNQYREVLTGADARIKSNRAYIKLASIGSTPFSAPAGRRRISMGYSSENAAQGFENIESGDAPMKVMINGTLYILRGEKVFDATGRLVK